MKILLKTASMIFLLAGVFRPVPAPASGVNFNDTSNIALAQVGSNVGIGTTTPQGGFVVTNGNVGIGTWAPVQLLDVKGTTRVANFIMSGQSPSNGFVLSATDSSGDTTWIPSTVGGGWTVVGSNTYLTTPSNNVGVGTTTPQGAFVITNGNVGIGTWAPTVKLDISGGNILLHNNQSLIGLDSDNVTQRVLAQVDSSGDIVYATDGINNVELHSGLSTKFFQAGGEKVRITSAGNVGIGTTNPRADSEAYFASPSLYIRATSNNPGIFLESAGATSGVLAWGIGSNTSIAQVLASRGGTNGGALSFYTKNDGGNEAVRMTIDQAGNMGIGPTAPVTTVNITKGSSPTTITKANSYLHLGSTQNQSLNEKIMLTFGYVDSSSTNVMAYIGTTTTDGNQFQAGDLVFGTRALHTDTAPTEAMRITSAGNVGIGTTLPNSKLNVGPVSNSTNQIQATGTGSTAHLHLGQFSNGSYIFNNYFYNSGHTTDDATLGSAGILLGNGDITFQYAAASATPTRSTSMYISTAGNVGIGTTTPQGAFVVTNGNVGIGTWTAADRLNIMGGNVGIGVTGTSDKLEVSSNDVTSPSQGGITLINSATAISDKLGIGFSQDGSDTRPRAGIYAVSELASGYASSLAFFTRSAVDGSELQNTDERVRINSGGSVGIGTTAPNSILEISRNATANYGSAAVADQGLTITEITGTGNPEGITFGGSPGNSYGGIYGRFISGSSNTQGDIAIALRANVGDSTFTEAMRIKASGNVGIGSTAPGSLLDVFGSARLANSGSLTVSGLVSCAGVQTSAAGLMSCTSDERLKDIHGSFNEGLSAISKINPKTYSWKKGSYLYDGGVRYSGFIAQDVEKAIPEAVNISAKGYKQVSTTPILAAAVNAIKEMDSKVQELAKENKALKARVEALEKEIASSSRLWRDSSQ